MTVQSKTVKQSIEVQRKVLISKLKNPLLQLAENCSRVWSDHRLINESLVTALDQIPYVKFFYALDNNARQISDNISHHGLIRKDFDRDRSQRPYITELGNTDFLLSKAYISLRAKRPSLTAIHRVRDFDNNQLGMVGADFDLRNLPLTCDHFEEPKQWRQLKGDPAIRAGVCAQNRTDSQIDLHIDDFLAVMAELIIDHGIFQTMMHFSSNRTTIWTIDDPFCYRLLDTEMLVDPNVCLVFPVRPYPDNAVIPEETVPSILAVLRKLRYMDEMFYLRSCSINIISGMVSLTFSCDGSHYIPFDEFLKKDMYFWIGKGTP